jgi:hypothetical protein
MMPSISIPRSWIADAAGVLRWEVIGYDDRIANWPTSMLAKLIAK